MAYSVKVDLQHRKGGQAPVRQVGAAHAAEGGLSGDTAYGDAITFSAGNPRVEHLTGVVHLYREIPAADSAQRPAWSQPVRCCMAMRHIGVLRRLQRAHPDHVADDRQ
jgi:hypothetical protein